MGDVSFILDWGGEWVAKVSLLIDLLGGIKG